MDTTLAPLSAADLDAIAAVSRAFSEALVRRDLDTLALLYSDDAALMPPNHPAVQGRAAIKAWLGGFPAVTQFELRVDRIDGRADLAYVRGAYTMVLKPGDAPETISDTGKFLEIRHKQPDGSWPFIVDMFSSDLA